MQRKTLAINLGLVLASVSIVFIGLEITLLFGIVEGDHNYPQIEQCYGGEDALPFHEEYGWTHPPNTKFITKNNPSQPWEKHTYNEKGFRDTYDTGADQNILVFGDSFTRGTIASDNATTPHLLERWTPNATVENYGVAGYGTAQELLLYRNVSGELNHSTVVVNFYLGNDMYDNVDTDPKRPGFETTESGVELVGEPSRESSGSQAEVSHAVQSETLRSMIDFLKQHTNTYPYLEPKLRSLLVRVGVISYPQPPTGEELQQQTELTDALLRELVNEAEQQNASVVLVSIPERSDVRPERPNKFKKSDGDPYWETQRNLLRAVADSYDSVTYQPMRPALSNATDDGREVYGTQNSHLDDPGYRVTAKTTYDHLVETGEIPDSNPNVSEVYTDQSPRCS